MRIALALLLLLAVASPASSASADDEPGSGLSFYKLSANAPALGIGPLYTDVAVTLPQTTSTLTTGGVGTGLAAVAWPGPVVGNLGTTVLVLKPTAPTQVTLLNDPVRAEAHTGTTTTDATNTTIPGTVMTSSAHPDKVVTTSSMGSTASPLADAGGLRGSAKVALEGTTGATSVARSAVTDLSFAAGLITIGSVVSTASATTDGVKAKAEGSTVVSGLKVAGLAVDVDQDGLHLASTSLPVPLPRDALNAVVKQLGLTVVLTQGRKVVSGATASFDAPALALVFTTGGKTYTVALGRASVSVDASAAPGSDVSELPPLPTAPDVAVPTLPRVEGGTPPLAGSPVVTEPQPQVSTPQRILHTALVPVSYVLGHGAPTALLVVGLLAVTFLALWLRRLPDRVLELPAVECDERFMT